MLNQRVCLPYGKIPQIPAILNSPPGLLSRQVGFARGRPRFAPLTVHRYSALSPRTFSFPDVRYARIDQFKGSPKTTRREDRECHLFLAGNRAVLLGNRRFSWREIASSLLKKRFLKGLSFFSKTIVREY